MSKPEIEIVETWRYIDRECKIVWVDLAPKIDRLGGHWCGYAKTTLEGKYSDDVFGPVRVHGGLTYGVDEDGWIGFDCAHAGDVCKWGDIEGNNYQSTIDAGRVWDKDAVKSEVEKMADQLTIVEDENGA